jgi:hypothetical protein
VSHERSPHADDDEKSRGGKGDFGSRFDGSGFGVQGSGFRVQGSGFGVQVSGFGVQGSGFRVRGSGFTVHFDVHTDIGER